MEHPLPGTALKLINCEKLMYTIVSCVWENKDLNQQILNTNSSAWMKKPLNKEAYPLTNPLRQKNRYGKISFFFTDNQMKKNIFLVIFPKGDFSMPNDQNY